MVQTHGQTADLSTVTEAQSRAARRSFEHREQGATLAAHGVETLQTGVETQNAILNRAAVSWGLTATASILIAWLRAQDPDEETQ
jgi:hypothetical protein